MSALRQEILNYIGYLPDTKLEALKPILAMLVNDNIAIETDLNDEEKSIIAKGRQEYKKGNYISLDSLT